MFRIRPTVLAALLLAAGAHAASEPYIPADDSTVLERLAPQPAEAAALRGLRAQRQALAERPDDLALALDYARRAIERGRATADPRWHGQAEAALAQWLALAAPPPEVRLLRATLRQQRHDFGGALADLDALLAARPDNPQARLTRATVLLVQGRPAEALPDCDALLAARRNLLAAAVCITAVRSLDGHLDAAAAALAAALADSSSAPAGERRWAWTALAELEARRGRNEAAEAAFRSALALLEADGEADPYLLTARADFLLATGRAAEALAVTAPFAAIDNLLLRRALAEAALGDAGLAASIATLDARLAESRLRGEAAIHLREEALHALKLRNDPHTAVQLAQRNWDSQREPADARLLLACALAARQPAAAQPVLAWMQRTGIEDAELHALAARLAAGAAR
jgi:hypothetical protein